MACRCWFQLVDVNTINICAGEYARWVEMAVSHVTRVQVVPKAGGRLHTVTKWRADSELLELIRNATVGPTAERTYGTLAQQVFQRRRDAWCAEYEPSALKLPWRNAWSEERQGWSPSGRRQSPAPHILPPPTEAASRSLPNLTLPRGQRNVLRLGIHGMDAERLSTHGMDPAFTGLFAYKGQHPLPLPSVRPGCSTSSIAGAHPPEARPWALLTTGAQAAVASLSSTWTFNRRVGARGGVLARTSEVDGGQPHRAPDADLGRRTGAAAGRSSMVSSHSGVWRLTQQRPSSAYNLGSMAMDGSFYRR